MTEYLQGEDWALVDDDIGDAGDSYPGNGPEVGSDKPPMRMGDYGWEPDI